VNVIFVNATWLLLERIVRILVGLFVSVWLARYLGPSLYGQLAYVVTMLILLQVIARLGMDGILIREFSIQSGSHDLFYTSLFLRGGVSFVLWIVSSFLFYAIGSYSSFILFSLAALSIILQSTEVIEFWLQSQNKVKLSVAAKLLAFIVSNGIRAVCIYFEAPLWVFALIISIEATLCAILLLVVYSKISTFSKGSLLFSYVTSLLKESWPYIFSGIAITLYMRIDLFYIKKYLGDESVGVYAAVFALSSQLHFIPMILQRSVSPTISRLKKKSEKLYISALSKLFRVYVLLGLIICIPVSLLSAEIISLLYGNAYSLGAEVLAIHVYSILFVNLGIAQSIWMVNEGRANLALFRTIFGLLVSIILNYLLIPRYGMVGAALTAVIAQFSQAIFSNIFFSRNMLVFQLKSIFLIPSNKI
jgi:O-antigen/teichoic acid export membrane protein